MEQISDNYKIIETRKTILGCMHTLLTSLFLMRLGEEGIKFYICPS